MTRRPWLVLSIVVLVAAAATGALILTRENEEPSRATPSEARAEGLTLLVVRTRSGPFAAVVGSTGKQDGALVVPSEIQLTIPGQGDATLDEALNLPPRESATAMANLLGVWVDHYAVLGADRLAEIVDRAGGITIGSDRLTGAEAVSMLESSDQGGGAAFTLVVDGLLQADAGTWQESDFTKSDAPADVLADVQASNGAGAAELPVDEGATGIFLAQPEAVRAALVDVFGGPDREVVNVIVLNGSGLPGVGELVAEQIVPAGFRVVVSQNASNFDHEETLVVVGSADDVALGERVRDLLGTGSVNVSVASGIAPVTIVVGKDFAG
jgi:hypothetical protein